MVWIYPSTSASWWANSAFLTSGPLEKIVPLSLIVVVRSVLHSQSFLVGQVVQVDLMVPVIIT